MNFTDRVKEILLKENEEQIEKINTKIKEITELHSKEQQDTENLKQQVDKLNEQKSEFARSMVDKKLLKDLEIIYEFVHNYPRIEKITNLLRQMPIVYESNPFSDAYTEENAYKDEMNKRNLLLKLLTYLNNKITEINDADIEDLVDDKKTNAKEQKKEENKGQTEDQNQEQEPEKRGILAKLFGKKKKNTNDIKKEKDDSENKEDLSQEDLSNEENSKFDEYRKVINEYNRCYNRFLLVNSEENFIVDKASIKKIIANIKGLILLQKRGIELDDNEIEYLYMMQPLELWSEILKYYNNTTIITQIVQNFERKIDEYERLYKERPELFDLKNLEKIFKENNQLVIDFKSKKKDVTAKANELSSKKQNEKEKKAQLKALENKKKNLVEEAKKIQEAKTLKQLGFKNKADAVKKLSIESKDYIVIPIPDDIKKISEVFEEEKQIKVEIDGKTFFGVYKNDIASGRINTDEHLKDINAVLMIPIENLKKEDIDNIKSGKISVNQSVLSIKGLLVIMPTEREIDFEDSDIEMKTYSKGSINEHLIDFLGDDYVIDSDEIENYDIFKNIPNTSNQEKKNKRDAVRECLFENVNRDISHTDTILVDGKAFFLNFNDEKELHLMPKNNPLDETKLEKISDEIETYLIEDGKTGAKIDELYMKLLLEYMRVNKKARADYQDEENTIISLNGKNISIKPPLPPKDETIAKRYARKGEDIAYRTMKLACLINKFAHLTDNEELQNKLYQNKLDLIENVIDLAKNNPNIKIKKKFDDRKMVKSVILEIPGYNMIALHIMNRGKTLMKKANELEENNDDVLQTSTILYPGVNRNLLLALKKMDVEERKKALLQLDQTTLYKLVLRMGYNLEKISSPEGKINCINDIVSDAKLSELLKEDEEQER